MLWAQKPIKNPTVINIINCIVKLHRVMSMPFACLSECAITALLPAQFLRVDSGTDTYRKRLLEILGFFTSHF